MCNNRNRKILSYNISLPPPHPLRLLSGTKIEKNSECSVIRAEYTVDQRRRKGTCDEGREELQGSR